MCLAGKVSFEQKMSIDGLAMPSWHFVCPERHLLPTPITRWKPLEIRHITETSVLKIPSTAAQVSVFALPRSFVAYLLRHCARIVWKRIASHGPAYMAYA